ncbi:hypothetical protein IGB42_01507 [Andreprevotia sp. IGB-42]|uniref:substrate-binding periplasmic protein n=1 Tax=Andreprevotia sp. IGB-42 TaxID=2497473 RepID=UPI001358D884|nr:transporter substrate-binding domain-containing protein [Andreprevotia sp. IGB-42]KAF0813828.1 hypothetical protein IGB42_01507 [Andreprevotia sp. IGB-42]
MPACLRICLLLLLIGIARPGYAAAQTVVVYNYYDLPPFITGSGKGLTHALTRRLNTVAPDRYRFQVVSLPRRRLDLQINQPGPAWVVPWANPAWFGDTGRQRYRWSPPLLRDHDWWLSRQNHPLTPEALKSASGLQFGGLLGHHYGDLDPAIDAERIKRYDALDYASSLRMLQAGRVDFISMPISVMTWLQRRNPELFNAITALPRGQPYERHLFSAASDPALADFISTAMQRLAQNPSWQQELQAYQRDDVPLAMQ